MRNLFSTEEKQQLIQAISSGVKIAKSAKVFAKSMNRPEGSVITKMYDLKRSMGLAPKRAKKVKTRKVSAPKVVEQKLVETFSMNFKPSRTEVHRDHVRLYF